MLVLTVHMGDVVRIGDSLIAFRRTREEKTRMAIQAPPEIRIDRWGEMSLEDAAAKLAAEKAVSQ